MKLKLLISLLFLSQLTIFSQNKKLNSENYLHSKTSLPKDIPAPLPFFDDFEDGDFSDYNDLGGTITTEVNNNVSTNSLNINGGSFGSGLSRSLESATPNYISFYVQSPQIADQDPASGACYFEIGDKSNGTESILFWMSGSRGKLTVFDAVKNESVGSIPFSLNTWYNIEFKNIDFTSQSFDFYVDGVLDVASVPFTVYASEFSLFELHNYKVSNSSEGYWDDISVMNVDPVNISENKKSELTLFPNPTTGKINFTNNEVKFVSVINLFGQILIEKSIDQNNNFIDLSDLKKGTYFINSTTKNGNFLTKILKI